MKRFLGLAVLLCAAAITLLVAQKTKTKRAPQDSDVAQNTVDAAMITQAEGNLWHNTPRQECRSLVTDSKGRLWTLGVESDGNQEQTPPPIHCSRPPRRCALVAKVGSHPARLRLLAGRGA